MQTTIRHIRIADEDWDRFIGALETQGLKRALGHEVSVALREYAARRE